MIADRKCFLLLAIGAALSGAAAKADDAGRLPSLNAPIHESSVSGISSGAFMSVQFGVAWSSVIKGVGVVAGGPYYCAQASTTESALTLGTGAILTATGPCMVGPLNDIGPMLQQVRTNAASGDIDPPRNIARQKIYLFHGYNDKIVAKSVTDATARFYAAYLGDKAEGNLFYQSTLGAGHSLVVPNQTEGGLDACPANKSPYIDQCGYDQAGILLQHIYGELNPPTPGKLGGALKSFDQSLYTGNDIPGAISLADEGYVFVPKECEQGAECRVHLALHGCTQNVESIGKTFIERGGYNRWADANRIIVLYPQTTSSPFAPFNPDACWDWWGYVTGKDRYVTKSGKQIAALKAMLDAVTASAKPPVGAKNAPLNLILNDRTDTAVALAWTAAPGASAYRISRAGADGQFQVVADTVGQSYADRGLSPATSYNWEVAPIVNGVGQTPSNRVSAATLPTPAPCNHPGSCPIAH